LLPKTPKPLAINEYNNLISGKGFSLPTAS